MNNLSFVAYSGHKVYLHIIVVTTVYYSIMQYSIDISYAVSVLSYDCKNLIL